MGAIAGSSILECKQTLNLDTVTLTINNSCNLVCPHCYLQYQPERSDSFDSQIFSILSRSSFRHLAIVGKEPLFNTNSIDLCLRLSDLCFSTGKTISLISNGINFALAPSNFVNKFSFIDISLDGGPQTYKSYRKASTFKLVNNLRAIASLGARMNALHVLNSKTIDHLDDMLDVRNWAPFDRVIFSPYLETQNHGHNLVGGLNLTSLLRRLASSRFSQVEGAILLLHDQHIEAGSLTHVEFNQLTSELNLNHRVHLISGDPLEYGILRVTYDGLVLTPYAALHPKKYASERSFTVADLGYKTLNDAFLNMAPSPKTLQ
ncbi:hypothetical protein MGMO_74c00060 [Methyloglobulus morosus KoM1]|uniref:Radical SAM domain-containing protein n=1 Tax=Methyloglobulus morosus KoM1 TaxID=1116472 RepID=V5BW45_9GAMM|nr:radical SAM protein [Methyloglobulus morosus]ESS72054.1 hypothetical protein MGMO_74c00060 [Methyloglobulus morosus KoM1]